VLEGLAGDGVEDALLGVLELVGLLAAEALDLGAEQVPRDGLEPGEERGAALEVVDVVVGEDVGLVGDLVDEVRHGRVERDDRRGAGARGGP
jgi:hypothetical protein